MQAISEGDSQVKFVRGRSDRRKPNRKTPASRKARRCDESDKCPRYGYGYHVKANCPARNEKCAKCRKKDHFSRVCKSYKTKVVYEEEDSTEEESEDAFESENESVYSSVKAVCSSGKNDDERWETVRINGVPTRCQIDTGTAQSLLPYNLYEKLKCGSLKKADKNFSPTPSTRSRGYGYINLPVAYKECQTKIKFYVVELQEKPLLSGEASKHLGLIEGIHKIKDVEDFPELKKTTGTPSGKHNLKIDPTVQDDSLELSFQKSRPS